MCSRSWRGNYWERAAAFAIGMAVTKIAWAGTLDALSIEWLHVPANVVGIALGGAVCALTVQDQMPWPVLFKRVLVSTITGCVGAVAVSVWPGLSRDGQFVIAFIVGAVAVPIMAGALETARHAPSDLWSRILDRIGKGSDK